MAQINEEIIAIKISRIAKDGMELESVVNDEIVTTLESVAQELVGEGAIVEIVTGE